MIAALSLLVTFVFAEDRPWGVEGQQAKVPPPCAQFLSVRESNQIKLAQSKRRAEVKVKAVTAAIAELPKPLRATYANLARAVEAAVTKHHHEYEEEPNLRKLDYPRHLAILEKIAAFDDKRAQWSLYQIKRVIETRHSLRQYADCAPDDDDDHADPTAH